MNQRQKFSLKRVVVGVMIGAIVAATTIYFSEMQKKKKFVKCWFQTGAPFFAGVSAGPVSVNAGTIEFDGGPDVGPVQIVNTLCVIMDPESDAN